MQQFQPVSTEEQRRAPDVAGIAQQVPATVVHLPDEALHALARQPVLQCTGTGDHDDGLESRPVDPADEVEKRTTGTAPVLVGAQQVPYSRGHDPGSGTGCR
jgi:hypothetical protein